MAGLPNWIDLIVVISLWRAGYVGLGRGVWAELVALLTTVIVTVATVFYWDVIYRYVQPYVEGLPQADFIVFLVVLLILTLAMLLTVRRLAEVMKTEAHDWFFYSFGMLLGAARGLWVGGFILLVISSSGWQYAIQSMQDASFGHRTALMTKSGLEWIGRYLPGVDPTTEQRIPSIH